MHRANGRPLLTVASRASQELARGEPANRGLFNLGESRHGGNVTTRRGRIGYAVRSVEE